jgi:hypothetical protein
MGHRLRAPAKDASSVAPRGGLILPRFLAGTSGSSESTQADAEAGERGGGGNGETIRSPKTAKAPQPAPDLMEALERTRADIEGETSKEREKQET